MTRHTDHPLVRRDLSCSLCNGYKPGGKVMCSECHIELETRGSDAERDYAEERLDAAESQFEANEILGVWA